VGLGDGASDMGQDFQPGSGELNVVALSAGGSEGSMGAFLQSGRNPARQEKHVSLVVVQDPSHVPETLMGSVADYTWCTGGRDGLSNVFACLKRVGSSRVRMPRISPGPKLTLGCPMN